MTRRGWLIFMALALVSAFFITRGLIAQPGFTDAFYHFNAANRLVSGQGLTDAYLWTYIGAPDSLPAPSHTYWMPLTSLSAALGMWLFNAPGSYAAAQVPFALMLAGTAGVGFWLGGRIGGTARHAWIAGLLTVFSGFYTRFWGATDTFAPYALMGSLCLVLLTPPPSPLSVHGEGGNVADDDSSLDNNRFPSTLVGRSAAFLAVEGLGVRGNLTQIELCNRYIRFSSRLCAGNIQHSEAGIRREYLHPTPRQIQRILTRAATEFENLIARAKMQRQPLMNPRPQPPRNLRLGEIIVIGCRQRVE